MPKRRTLYLIDGSNYLYRAYHAIRSLTNSQGFATNALYGFTIMLRKLIDDEAPDLLAVVFDLEDEVGFRKDIYPAYKATRKPKPDDLLPQLPIARELTEAFNIPTLYAPSYEADDLIATVAEMALGEAVHVVVVSSDKDLMQLVGDDCVLLDTMKGVRYDRAEVEKRYGVRPEQIVDMLALMGDSSDNIPGVPGIGPKTAATLLSDYGDLDGIYANIDAIKGKRRETLAENKAEAYLSKRLATLVKDVDLGLEVGDLARREPNRQALSELFGRLEFKALQREFHDVAASQAPAAIEEGAYEIVGDEAALTALGARAAAAERLALTLVTSDTRPLHAEIIGIAVATSRERAAYVPIGHRTLDAGPQIPLARALAALGPALGDAAVKKTVYDAKIAYQVLERAGVTLRGVDADPMLMGYLLDAGQYQQSLENLAMTWLEHKKQSYEEIGGKGAKRRPESDIATEVMATYAGEEALLTLSLGAQLGERLASEGLTALYEGIELPLARVLADMERAGVLVDEAQMSALSEELGGRARALEAQAHEAAGREFALGSPKQLAEILFHDLGLPVVKKTRTGYSTDSVVLEELRDAHPLPALVLEWRQLSKLKGTYTDALPALIHPETGRIHTVFNQAVAATGRLSSEAPNLQNIPIRTEEGRRIREAFVAPPGCVLVSADYSQIELRILAHLSGDERMRETFREGADIHRRTAAEILSKSPDEVTFEERGMAKTINFGILYGMSAFRLARELDISRTDAARFIEAYYARFPRIRAWKEGLLETGRATGFVSTMLGRIRNVSDLRSRNGLTRSGAERVAVNTPVQGTAADIIKAAMVRIQPRLLAELPATRMVLQVHDELVFEAPEGDAEALMALAVEEMSSVIDLAVPLEVNAAAGRNWLEAH